MIESISLHDGAFPGNFSRIILTYPTFSLWMTLEPNSWIQDVTLWILIYSLIGNHCDRTRYLNLQMFRSSLQSKNQWRKCFIPAHCYDIGYTQCTLAKLNRMPQKGKSVASRIMYTDRKKSLTRKPRLSSSQSIYSLVICKSAVRNQRAFTMIHTMFFRKFELIAHILKYSH